MRKVLTPVLFLFFLAAQAQESVTDSLERVLQQQRDADTNKVTTLYRLSGEYLSKDLGKAFSYGNEALKLARELGDKEGEAKALNNLGLAYQETGDYNEAIDCFFKSLQIREENHRTAGIGNVYNSIGLIFDLQGKSDKAKTYYNDALKSYEAEKDSSGLATTWMNLGILDAEQNNLPGAIAQFTKAEKIYLAEKDSLRYSDVLLNVGELFEQANLLDSAFDYYWRGMTIRQHLQDSVGLSLAYNNVAVIYFKKKNYPEAENYLQKAAAVAESQHALPRLASVYSNLSELYDSIGDYKKAYRYHILYKTVNDSLFSIHSNENASLAEMKYLTEKQKNEEKIREEAKNREQRLIVIFLVVIILVVSGFSVFLFNRFRIIRRQKTVIEEKNKEIFDSITYAQRLQEAILPPLKLVRSYFPESFIFYRPKDIVAGDFYWTEISTGGDKLFFAVADCTGHGVPGAMVSVVCSNALNRSVKEFGLTDPGKILDKVTQLVLETFEKSETAVKDGMDISLCCLDRKNGALTFAGANNSLWVAHGGEIATYKADSQPVGKYDHLKPFTTHVVAYEKGDWIYMGSDGYADQFGGEKGKKFKTANLRRLLETNSGFSADIQLQNLATSFDSWKGNLEQVDDVCVFGVRVG